MLISLEDVYISLHYITLYYVTWHYITLHYITLHMFSISNPSLLLRWCRQLKPFPTPKGNNDQWNNVYYENDSIVSDDLRSYKIEASTIMVLTE